MKVPLPLQRCSRFLFYLSFLNRLRASSFLPYTLICVSHVQYTKDLTPSGFFYLYIFCYLPFPFTFTFSSTFCFLINSVSFYLLLPHNFCFHASFFLTSSVCKHLSPYIICFLTQLVSLQFPYAFCWVFLVRTASSHHIFPSTICFTTLFLNAIYFLTQYISLYHLFPDTIYFLTPSVSSQKLFPYIVSSHHLFSYTICFLPHPLFATLNCMNISFISVTPISPFQSL